MEKNEKKIISKNKVLQVCTVILICIVVYKTTIGVNTKISVGVYLYYIPEEASIYDLADKLKEKGIIRSRLTFIAMALLSGITNVDTGLYKINNNSNNMQLCKSLRNPLDKKAVKISIPVVQQRQNLIKSICKKTKVYPDDVWKLLNNAKYLKELGGFTKENIFCMFIAGDYVCEMTHESKVLLENIYSHYMFFWNEERTAKALAMGFTKEEIIIFASIVYAETKIPEEMPIIAGVYYNRLQKKMKLESDPTLKFANKKYNAKRVMDIDKKTNSPYNTYKYNGLPPGPICTVPPAAIDAVLNYEGHDYLYFCAKDDLSGEHVFSESYDEHLQNAKKYRERLDKEKIF